jgi:hypothetical protein
MWSDYLKSFQVTKLGDADMKLNKTIIIEHQLLEKFIKMPSEHGMSP